MEKTRTDPDLSETILTFSDMLFRIALSFTKDSTASEDIIQDVFLHYMTDGTLFLDQEHKKAWLIRVTVNECKKYHRSVWNRKRIPLEDIYPFETEEKHEVFYLVMSLPAKYRILIHLYYYEGLSVKEISSLLQLKESTIQSRLFRARKKLRKEMEVPDENSGL